MSQLQNEVKKQMPGSVALWILVGAFTILAAWQTYREMKQSTSVTFQKGGRK
jgi:hypothetical protein